MTKKSNESWESTNVESMHSELWIDHEAVKGPEGLLFAQIHQQHRCHTRHALTIAQLAVVDAVSYQNIEELLLLCTVSFAKDFMISKASKNSREKKTQKKIIQLSTAAHHTCLTWSKLDFPFPCINRVCRSPVDVIINLSNIRRVFVAQLKHSRVRAPIIGNLLLDAEHLLPDCAPQRFWNSLENTPPQLFGIVTWEFIKFLVHFEPFLCALPLHVLLLPLVFVKVFGQGLRVDKSISNKTSKWFIIIIKTATL